jgi:peptide/nickel transport system substrate-binding protein
MRTNMPPFDNVDVRNALKYAINREEIIEKIAFGAAVLGNDFHHNPVSPFYPSDIPQREYDPDMAKSLLKKAGAEGLEVSLSTADKITSSAVDLATLYSEHAKAAGIKINVVREPNDNYHSLIWMKKPWCMVQWGGRPVPDMMYSVSYIKDAPWNDTNFHNERFEELLFMGRAELNNDVRAEIYREMAMILRDQGGTVLPMYLNTVFAARANVGHSENVAANWPFDGARAAHRWWFKS